MFVPSLWTFSLLKLNTIGLGVCVCLFFMFSFSYCLHTFFRSFVLGYDRSEVKVGRLGIRILISAKILFSVLHFIFGFEFTFSSYLVCSCYQWQSTDSFFHLVQWDSKLIWIFLNLVTSTRTQTLDYWVFFTVFHCHAHANLMKAVLRVLNLCIVVLP